MVKEKADLIVNKFHGEITEGQEKEICGRLKDLPDDKYEKLDSVKVKKRALTVILSSVLGLFGAGSFYLGYIRRGIIKVVFNFILPFALGMIFLCWLAPLHKEYSSQSWSIRQSVDPYYQSGGEFKGYINAYNNEKTSTLAAYVSSISSISSNGKIILNSIEYFNGLTETEYNSDFALLQEKFTLLNNSALLSGLADKVDEALVILAGLEESDGEEGKDNLTDKVNAVSQSVSDLSTYQLDVFIEELEELHDKISALTSSTTLEDVTSATSDLSAAYITQSQEKINQFNSDLATVSEAGISSLIYEITQLNQKIFALQKANGTNEVESAADTPLGLELTSFEENYVTDELSFLNTDLHGGEGGKLTVSQFIDNLTAQTNDQIKAVSSIAGGIYDDVEAAEPKNLVLQLAEDMIAGKNGFVEDYRSIFVTLNTDFVGNLRKTNKELPEAVPNTVEKNTGLTEKLSSICESFEKIDGSTDFFEISTQLNNIQAQVDGLRNSADENYTNWTLSYRYQSMFFGFILTMDIIVIVAYWIAEVFKERDKCMSVNYENLMKAID